MTNRYLPTALRRILEKTVKDARIVAEEGAGDAIQRLGVADGKAPSYLNDAEKGLRRRLRAHARALGDAFNRSDESQETKRLLEAAAYAHWHRMLFARFLAERGLLRNPEYDVPVSLEDCRELAEAEGLTDPWVIAERYAASMLPAVFRIDDPVLALELDPVHTQKLHRLVTGLDAEVFQAEDSLGWTYQFWRAAEKDAVNASGVKTGADELPAVTQLFTEPYMVRFLLHNTLGAWWAGKVLAADPALAQSAADEAALRAACSLPGYTFDMLRFVREGEDGPWRPAAGTFPGWPKEARAVTVLDPCCGSGHFLTEALAILTAFREADENLLSADAVAAVLRDNLHGLEIDGRCVQIAAFAVALSAWRIGGWQILPSPHIAWVGAPPPLPKREFVSLAQGDAELAYALDAMHELFSQAPILGSLLEPAGGDLFESEKMREFTRLLSRLISRAKQLEPDVIEGAFAARGMADAINMLTGKYTLVATNVPFLGRGEQSSQMLEYCDSHFPTAKQCLSTSMVQRTLSMLNPGGATASVTKQEWCFLVSYRDFRISLLQKYHLDFAVFLGEEAWVAFKKRGPLATLTSWTRKKVEESNFHFASDATHVESIHEKFAHIQSGDLELLKQTDQLSNPDSRITAAKMDNLPLLSRYAHAYQGISTGDVDRYKLLFWENALPNSDWTYFRSTVSEDTHFSGCQNIVFWGDGGRHFAALRGEGCFGKLGVAVSQMRHLPASLYLGERFDGNVSAIVPLNSEHVGPIFEYCSSKEYKVELRNIDKKKNITNATLTKVPFNLKKWQDVFDKKYKCGLPLPTSPDPTQWLFHGHPRNARSGVSLHVALARISGYRWPAESDDRMHLSDEARAWIVEASELPPADNDGLVGVPPVAGEKSLADRLRRYLAAAFGADWSDALERRLVSDADELLDKKVARDGSLETWLRDRAFRQHCALFGQRPFLWHISDGLKDGFSVLAHYHRFDQANLRKLTYTLLGDWLARAKAEGNTLRYEKGRELQQKLEKILEGEQPYDIFVRWKPLAQQPLGWDPDLDDGVRQNIRPFIKAGVLTHDLSKILKDKDRGNDAPSAPWYEVFKGERRNDHHTTLAEKRAARVAAPIRVEAAK
ncbi:SAM-dependent methyltransferase [Fodinicurvata sp. EGI_FJ10296]|uniref:Eco57I restriction-modification methylase domain-containing protein n=1 Tax=Fodinicurvata sp. EGI_FJ10296 TaxID=3231908 RepID=UPI0034562BA9